MSHLDDVRERVAVALARGDREAARLLADHAGLPDPVPAAMPSDEVIDDAIRVDDLLRELSEAKALVDASAVLLRDLAAATGRGASYFATTFHFPTPPAPGALDALLGAIREERGRQDAKFGADREIPNGTGFPLSRDAEFKARAACEFAFKHGGGTWRHILSEEVAEAFAETDEADLEKELVQIAAVAVAWAENLRRRREAAPIPDAAGADLVPAMKADRDPFAPHGLDEHPLRHVPPARLEALDDVGLARDVAAANAYRPPHDDCDCPACRPEGG